VVVRDSCQRDKYPDNTPFDDASLRHLTFKQMKEMENSGLLEIGSHTYASHGNVNIDDDGEMAPALVNRHYNTKEEKLESYTDYIKRVQNDLTRSQQILEKKLGRKDFYFAYPYGLYNDAVYSMVEDSGFSCALSVKIGRVKEDSDLFALPRYGITSGMSLTRFILIIR
ncbi:MAG: polysaccharide deacetylase family protein, partial [Clostridiales bacterium]